MQSLSFINKFPKIELEKDIAKNQICKGGMCSTLNHTIDVKKGQYHQYCSVLVENYLLFLMCKNNS